MESRFVIERPAEYSVAPTYRPTVVESALSKYVLEVAPLSFDKDRCSFSYRSPGLGVLQNSTLELVFSVRVTSRMPITMLGQLGPQVNLVQSASAAGAQAQLAGFTVNPAASRVVCATKICFGSGDAMQKAISSLQIIVNGAAIAQTRQRDYMRSLQKCWFDSSVFQKRFSQCGGTPQKYDSVAVQGEVLNRADTGAAFNGGISTGCVVGFTGDSGVADRLRNFNNAIIAAPTGANISDPTHDTRDIQVRWRINGTGLYNPLSRGDRVSSSCPFRQSARALPHQNVVSISILWSDLFKSLIRNFSTVMGTNNGAGVGVVAQTFAAGGNNAITVGFPPGADGHKARLYVEYLRLPSWRAQSGTALLQTFRVAVHDPSTESSIPAALPALGAAALDGNSAIAKCLTCTGMDRYSGQAANWRETGSGVAGIAPSYRECTWAGITAAQIPSMIFCVLEKSMDLTSHGTLLGKEVSDFEALTLLPPNNALNTSAGIAAKKNQYAARNSDSNAAITRFSLEIMSVQGSYIYSSESWPFRKNRGDLYRDVQKYMIDSGDDESVWFKHNCIVLLGASEFAKGISSPGAAFPVTFTVKARFENHRNYVDGHACGFDFGSGLGSCRDIISGRPVLGFIYPQQSLQVSASSALLSSQNISHASAMELLSRGAPSGDRYE